LLCDGLEVLELTVRDEVAMSFAGPKYWHLYDLIARQPLQIVRATADDRATARLRSRGQGPRG
jgi:hypothetical protein